MNRNKRELILSVNKKDFDIKFFSGTGAGGQHRNKHQNCVRMTHTDSGAYATGQSGKSRQSNIREAFRSIVKSSTFETWRRLEVSERLLNGSSIREKVKRMMKPENIKIEHGPF